MLQNACKILGFKKNMVYKIPPGGEVNHIQPVAYKWDTFIPSKVFLLLSFQFCIVNGTCSKKCTGTVNVLNFRTLYNYEHLKLSPKIFFKTS